MVLTWNKSLASINLANTKKARIEIVFILTKAKLKILLMSIKK